MKRTALILVRTVIGLTMLGTGVLKFVKPDFKVADDATLQSFIDSGWLWPLIGGVETIGGASLTSGQYVPLGLAVLTPVVVGILAFALKTGGEEASIGVLLAAAHGFLLWHNRSFYSRLFERTPAAQA
jgi:putative oxidoreductase